MTTPLTPLVPISCGYCFAISWAPPHGEGQPCPMKVATEEAYVAKLDAERMAHIRAAGGMENIAQGMRKFLGDGDE